MAKAFFALVLTSAVLAACSGGSAQHAATPGPSLRNPLDFPLYAGSTVISAKAFTQIVHADTASADSVFAQGNGKYSGREVIASSAASFGSLAQWLDSVNAAPPPGYTPLEPQSNAAQQSQAQRYGLDYALFKKKNGNETHGVLVIVMDPQRMNKRFGTVLGMIEKYKALPAALRGPIDDEAKARFGMTLTQATQPESPIGAALAALDELQHKNARGIVIVDAQKD